MFKKIFNPAKIKLNGVNKAIKPNAWKKRSETKLPWNPSRFVISVFSGKIKFGSSGEKLIRDINNNRPNIEILTPII